MSAAQSSEIKTVRDKGYALCFFKKLYCSEKNKKNAIISLFLCGRRKSPFRLPFFLKKLKTRQSKGCAENPCDTAVFVASGPRGHFFEKTRFLDVV